MQTLSVREQARAEGVSRSALYKRRQRAAARERRDRERAEAERGRQQADAVDLARAAAKERDAAEHRADELRGRLVEREEYISALEHALHQVRRAYHRERARAGRFSDEARDLRKKDASHRRFLLLAFALYDLLPESVWTALLAGHDVEATFRGAMVDDDDRIAWIAMDQRGLDIMGEVIDTLGEHAELLRMAVATRESLDMDDHRSQTDRARRDRFAQWIGAEIYGEAGDDD